MTARSNLGLTGLGRNGSATRRSLLKGAAGAAGLLASARLGLPAGAFAQGSGPEVRGTKLGYIALTDAAPLIIAREKGFYARHGVPDMEILRQASWGAVRDNVALGVARNGIDGAHILRPKVHMYTAGTVTANNVPVPMYNLLNLNEDCQGISVSNEYKDLAVGLNATPLKAAFERKKAQGKELTAAMTFPGGTHDLWIRYWLAAGGIDPETDIKVIVVPPAADGGEHEGRQHGLLLRRRAVERAARQPEHRLHRRTTGEIWNRHPEKVLGMRTDFVDANPRATQAILMAVMEAQMWCERPENKQEMAEIVSRRQWFNVPVSDIIGRIRGEINYGNGRRVTDPKLAMKFWGASGEVSYPWKSLDTWFITENMRWGKFPANTDVKALVDRTTRADLWTAAAKTLGVANAPTGDSRGVETFFDGMKFDPPTRWPTCAR